MNPTAVSPITNRRNSSGVKNSADQYRAGGAVVLWLDGMIDVITLRVVRELRVAGFKVSRTGDQVWVNRSDLGAIAALNIVTDR